ncbi:MAG: hypothetical protein EOL97_15305 [Spirochaetia bacterium]|nr:hypothetical protein [Spirochaetia bacterium]
MNKLTELESKIKARLSRNYIYFRVLSPIEIKDYSIYLDVGALLQKAEIKPLKEDEIYISVMYETTTDMEEGLLRLPITVLATLLYAKKIKAINVSSDEEDVIIRDLVLEERY